MTLGSEENPVQSANKNRSLICLGFYVFQYPFEQWYASAFGSFVGGYNARWVDSLRLLHLSV